MQLCKPGAVAMIEEEGLVMALFAKTATVVSREALHQAMYQGHHTIYPNALTSSFGIACFMH